MSLKSHREALSIGAIHHFLKTQGVRNEISQLTDIVLQRMRQGQCNFRVQFMNGKPLVLSDQAAEQTPARKGMMQ
jgi:hypothetical protein